MMQIEVTRINGILQACRSHTTEKKLLKYVSSGSAALFDEIQLMDDITYAELTVLIRAEFPLLKTVIVAADFDYEW